MDPQELAKQLKALEGQVSDLTKRAEGFESLQKAVDAAGFDITDDGKLEKRAEPEFIEVGGEKVEKSAVPAPLLKQLEAQNEQLKELVKANEDARIEKRGADELPNLAGTNLAKGKLLEAIGDDAEMLKAMRSADAAIAKQMAEIGNNPLDDESSATHKLNKMAGDYAKEHGTTFEVGYSEVTKTAEGRDLMVAAREEAH